MLCVGCQKKHLEFEGAKESFKAIRVSLTKADDATKDTEIKQLGLAVKSEIDRITAYLIQKVNERSESLKAEVDQVMEQTVNSREAWEENMKEIMATAKSFLDTETSLLGDVYDDHVTDEEISHITQQNQENVREIEQTITKQPPLSKPFVRYNTLEAMAAISSFGFIDVHPPGTKDCPVAVDVCSTQPDRPRVVGKRGSGPGKYINDQYLYLMRR
jgi:ABC-type transporter Mla subunit MlaD